MIEKCIDILGGHAWRHFFMACSKPEEMAIYIKRNYFKKQSSSSSFLLTQDNNTDSKWQ